MSAASDVYSLALTLYEAWTGTNPVRAGGPAATARRLGTPAAVAVGHAPRPAARAVRRDRRRARDRPRAAPHARASCAPSWPPREPELDDEGGLVEPETLRRVGLPVDPGRRSVLTRAPDRAPASARLAERPGRRPRGTTPRAPPGARPPRRAPARSPAASCSGCSRRSGPTLLLGARGRGRGRPGGGAAAADRVAARGGGAVRLAGLARGRPPGHRPDPRRGRRSRSRCCCRARGCSGRCPCSRRCSARSRSRPVFVGIAALAPTPWRRAGLGAAGFLWLAIGELLTGQEPAVRRPGRRAAARRLGGLDQRRRLRRARAAAVRPGAWRPRSSGPPSRWRCRWSCAAAGWRVDLLGAGLWAAGLLAGARRARRHAGRHDRAGPGARRRGGRDRRRAGGRGRVPDGASGGGLAPRPDGVRDDGIGLP